MLGVECCTDLRHDHIDCLLAQRSSILSRFHGNETLGADLSSKLALIPSALLFAVLHVAYYFACQTGSLDRIFRQAEFIRADAHLKYSLMAKVGLLAVICWALTTGHVIFYASTVFPDRLFDDCCSLPKRSSCQELL